jgi:hypothetical protein
MFCKNRVVDQIHIKKDLLKSIVKQKLFDQFVDMVLSNE